VNIVEKLVTSELLMMISYLAKTSIEAYRVINKGPLIDPGMKVGLEAPTEKSN
jgi:hypothetical protein